MDAHDLRPDFAVGSKIWFQIPYPWKNNFFVPNDSEATKSVNTNAFKEIVAGAKFMEEIKAGIAETK